MSARVGIVGITGYVGAELARTVLAHPGLELAAVVGRSAVGRRLDEVHPGLLGLTDLVVQGFDPQSLAGLDVVALATPHGVAKGLVGDLTTPRVLDLSADHRHAPGWVYGLVEYAEGLQGATRVAVPGCFASAIALSLAPFVAADVVRGPVHVTAMTGSTGSGATPSAGTHHPERFANVRAYKVLAHQHVPEVRGFLGTLGDAPPLAFVPVSGPWDRGIFASSFVPIDPDVDAHAILADALAPHPLLRLRQGTPELRHVRGTGFCDLAVHADEPGLAVVLAAIDNLGRGAAAQGVACLERMLGLAPLPPAPPVLP